MSLSEELRSQSRITIFISLLMCLCRVFLTIIVDCCKMEVIVAKASWKSTRSLSLEVCTAHLSCFGAEFDFAILKNEYFVFNFTQEVELLKRGKKKMAAQRGFYHKKLSRLFPSSKVSLSRKETREE